MVLQFRRILTQIFYSIRLALEKLQISVTIVGLGQSLIGSIFTGSTAIPSLDMIWPRNLTCSNQNAHFFNLDIIVPLSVFEE